jgi:hypothetical protein
MIHNICAKIFAAFLGFSIATCFVLVILILKDTIIPTEPPIEFSQATAIAFTQYDSTVVLITRPIKSSEQVDFLIERNITCDHINKKLSYDLNVSTMHIEKDQSIAMTKVLDLPILLPVGTNCKLYSTMKGSPTFSMKNEYTELPPVSFQVASRTIND